MKTKEMIEDLLKDFWAIDCLIRMMKELLFKQNWEMHESDVDIICEVLNEKSTNLSKKIQILKAQI